MQASASDSLIQRFHSATGNFVQALAEPQFYVQMLVIIASVAFALLAALLVRRIAKRHAQAMLDALPGINRFHLSTGIVTRPLKLLAPVLAIFILDALGGITQAAIGDGAFIIAAGGLAKAWLMVRIVTLVVRTKPVAWFISVIIIYLAIMHMIGLGHYMKEYLASLEFNIGKYHLSMLGLVHGIVIFVVVFWLANTLTASFEGYMRKTSRISYNARELILQLFRIIAYGIASLITLDVMGVDLTALAVFGGALGVGIGLGLQKLTANFVSGITLLLEKSVKIGDLIEVGGNTGWVRQLNTRYALLETFDGREILVPNEELTSSRVTNWTYSNPYARVEIVIPVSYDTDARQAQKLILESAHAYEKCLKEPAPSCVLREFADNGMKFQLTFWVPDVKEGRSVPQSEIMLAILDKFKAVGIKIPVAAS